jgi:LysR family glycine cleavage system transcriptional activator
LTGQGVALARVPLVADSLASGDLVEVLPGMRMDSPLVYWLMVGPRAAERPEIVAFCGWLQAQAAITRVALGEPEEAPNPALRPEPGAARCPAAHAR